MKKHKKLSISPAHNPQYLLQNKAAPSMSSHVWLEIWDLARSPLWRQLHVELVRALQMSAVDNLDTK